MTTQQQLDLEESLDKLGVLTGRTHRLRVMDEQLWAIYVHSGDGSRFVWRSGTPDYLQGYIDAQLEFAR